MENKARQTFDYDVEKATLIRKSNLLEGNIEEDLDKLKGYVQEYGKNALIITGTLLASYLLVRLISKSSEEEDKTYKALPPTYPAAATQPVIHMVNSTEESPIMKQIKSSIALFLISIAKQKLQDFLANASSKEKSE